MTATSWNLALCPLTTGFYQVPGGLTLTDLRAATAALAWTEVVGIKVDELETCTQHEDLAPLLGALEPLLASIDVPDRD
ncbi:hypothetical protein [Actinomyces wuliandei]|uniref:hypothetical protein n=1 Tax=Actinomyces wuliandei TaxID=2057743 RepID=UPI000FDB7228|nr:hypothetical protein [Actinomyces wuliandei]